MNVWKKLNLKDETRIAVVDPPDAFAAELEGLSDVEVVSTVAGCEFVMAFVTTRKQIERQAKALSRMADGDVKVWFCYPKTTSKRYTCDFNRDSGWEPLFAAGFKGVRQVAIDEDWSALRFRRIQYVNSSKSK